MYFEASRTKICQLWKSWRASFKNNGKCKDFISLQEGTIKTFQKLGMVDSVQFTIFNLIVQFTSMTTLRLEGGFGMYNMKQIVPSPLEFKYLASRSALDYALTSALGLQSKSKRATRYNHEDTCIVPLTYKRRKGDSTFIRASERINQETKEMIESFL